LQCLRSKDLKKGSKRKYNKHRILRLCWSKKKVKSEKVKVKNTVKAKIIIKLCQSLNEQKGVAKVLSNQLLRSGTSIGANVVESEGAQRKVTNLHKDLTMLG